MKTERTTWAQRWIYALKPMSWPKLFVPMVLGQALGLSVAQDPLFGGIFFGLLFTTFDLVFIVLLNDWGDRHVDALKRQMFPEGCSPKTIPDGILSSKSVLVGGLLAGFLAVLTGFIFEYAMGRIGLGLGTVAALVMFGVYTFGPIKLNYRGGGELVETLGVGLVLPWLNAYAVGGVLWHERYGMVLAGFVCLSFASALASGLADEQSDRAGGKRTFTTHLGNQTVRQAIFAAMLAGILIWLALAIFEPSLFLAASSGALVATFFLWQMQRMGHLALTNAFSAQKRYKLILHRAIWWGATIFALILGVMAFIG